MAKSSKKKSEATVALSEVIDELRIQGEFLPAVVRVAERKLATDAARKAGIKVTTKELQKAADTFRVLNNLHKASDTKRWLKANCLTLETLESHLESDVLIRKFRAKLAQNGTAKAVKSPKVQAAIREAAYQQWLESATT